MLILVGFFRGDGKTKSTIGVEKCAPADHGLLAGLILFALAELLIGIWIIRSEQPEKKRLGYPLETGDLEMKFSTILMLVLLGFIGGFGAGGFGLGPASIFCPILFQFGMLPAVASDTAGMVSTIGTLSGTILIIFAKKLNLAYCGVILIVVVVGTMPGLKWQFDLVTKYNGRTSITIFFLLLQLTICVVTKAAISISVWT